MKKLFLFTLTILILICLSNTAFADTYDDFGDGVIDTTKWDTWGDNIFTEQNGSLNFDGASTGSLIAGGLSSRLLLEGEFEITFDYRNLRLDSYDNPLSPNPTGFMLQINSPEPINQQYITPNFIGLGAQYYPTSAGWQFGSYFGRTWEGGTQGGVSAFSDDPLYGSMKISKTGSEIKTLFFDDSIDNWQTAATYNANDFPNIFSGPVEVNLKGGIGGDINSFHAELDNVEVEVEADSQSDGVEKRYAIILGNADYGEWLYNEQGIEYNGPGDKDFNILNAKRMNSILKGVYDFEQDGSILLLDETHRADDDSNLSIDSIKNAIDSLPSDYDDTVVFYYSGEGTENGIRTNWGNISDSELISYLKDVEAKHVDVILESCNSGSFIDEYQTQIGSSKGSIYASSAADESSIGQSFPVVGGSVFSTWFMDGLTNKNLLPAYLRPFYANGNLPSLFTPVDANGDGILTEQETFNYAKAMTNAATWWDPQNPEMFPLSGNDTIAELNGEFNKRVSNISFFMGSPADLVIADPFGNILSKNQNDFGDNAFYFEGDIFGDGHIYSIASIFSIVEGGYTATVIPYIDAEPTDTFSLYSYLNSNYYIGGYNVFAENTKLMDISPEGYTHSVSPVPEPNTLILLSLGLIGGMFGLRKKRFQV